MNLRKRRDNYAPKGPRIASTFIPPGRDAVETSIDFNAISFAIFRERARLNGWTPEQIANVAAEW